MNRSVITLGVVVLAVLSVSGLAGVAVEGTLGVDASQPAPTESVEASSATTPHTDSVSPDTSRSEKTAAVVTQSTEAPSTPEAVQPTPADSGTDIDTARLEDRLVAAINDRRGNPVANDAFDGSLSDETKTGQKLSAMAGNHSQRMAAQGLASPIANGSDTTDRYAAAGLSEQCRLRHEGNAYLRPVTDLELVTSIDPNGANATRTANAVADHWFDLSGPRDTLYVANANHIGVGAATADGVVYITVNLC
ncbi:CAP domain-containing protein [Haloarcula marismortui]|uniref:CAP domain-containing protein n=1 Tax=Haloarcula marismortui TaxID=2238 RepID=UPI003C73C5A7